MYKPDISLMNLFETGSHFGGSKSKLNPQLKNFVHSIDNSLCIIDLVKTIDSLNKLCDFFYKLGKEKKQILIVGTFDHIKSYTLELSKQFSLGQMPYVNYRWLGGTLSNWSTIKKTLKTLEKIENIESNKDFYSKLTRNEKLNLRTKKNRISKFFNGLTNLKNNKPGCILVLDTYFNPVAVQEGEKNNVPVVCFTNTNSKTLPRDKSKLIVCNTNSVKTISLINKYLVDAYNKGYELKQEEKTQINN